MVNDSLSDFITRIRNGYRAGRREVEAPMTKTAYRVAQVMVKRGYLAGVEKDPDKITLTLKYEGKKPTVMGIRRVSKPGRRVYSTVKDLPKVWGRLGMNILSTPKGIVDDREAKALKAGGEIVAQVW